MSVITSNSVIRNGKITLEKDLKVKHRMHPKACPSPPEGIKQVRLLNKAMTLKEFYNDEAERIRIAYERH